MTAWGGVLPLFRYNREVCAHNALGGEQTRTATVTWLRCSITLTFTSRWRAGR